MVIFLVKEYIVRENDVPKFFFDMMKSIGNAQYIPMTFKNTNANCAMPKFVADKFGNKYECIGTLSDGRFIYTIA